ncbi:MAG: hypothetical protein KDK64_07080 [Chlamydiia bacterium]|nr:hypothetical protein [Chlamydiia bacterium]
MEAVKQFFYNYFYSFDVSQELENVRACPQEKPLEKSVFHTKLLYLIGKQEENQAIQLILKTVIAVEQSPDLYLAQDYFDFQAPRGGLACGRSFQHLAGILDLHKLSYLFRYIQHNNISV